MGFSDQQKAFITESYFRNGRKIGGKWKYSVKDCIDEFKSKYPDVAVDYKSFQSTLMRCVKNFRETGSVQRKEGSGRPSKRNPNLIDGTCHKILKEDLKQDEKHES
ncbi:uncharacterized protein LOC123307270 [Coccinella septempunctata]|uniref:uncharacterized protein LOC123307270 n=1 Tax=Coccinella septempunctata TaxID=41139 RepID=UPI001D0713B0|nr:uncharacterized protein LOC123307270 [Coccinella septempunctata]